MNEMSRVRRNRRKHMSFIEYIEETWKNKLYAIAMMVASTVPIIYDNDATALVFMSFIAIPMFFSKKSWVY